MTSRPDDGRSAIPLRATARALLGATLLTLPLAAGCGREEYPDARRPATAAGPAAATPAAWPETGEWAMPAKDYANTRYSGLDQITAANVARLRPTWTFATGTLHGHEGQPLVVDHTMFVVTPFPNVLYAFDLTREGYPLKWKYRPDVNPASRGVACCDIVNRGATYHDGLVIYNLLDGHTVAIDARTGEEVWKRRVAIVEQGETLTMAPIVVKGRVIVGNSGGEYGVRGWLAALDARTGEEVWRAYSTGPDEEVLIDPATYDAFYAKDEGVDLGVTTWPPGQWRIGAGTAWLWISYDPELDLLYYGTGNPGPWNHEQRPGANKWTATTFARDPDDGFARWAYQQTPHDVTDYDGTNEKILVDLPIDGRMRRLLVFFDRNGFAYTMDRATGEILVVEPFVPLTWARGVSRLTGLPDVVPEHVPSTRRWTRFCPSHFGGKDQQPAAFSPRTRLFYVPTNNICEEWLLREVNYIAGTPYLGVNSRLHPGPGGHLGEFIAWDATTGRKVWGIPEAYPVWGGALATAGDVVFYGTMEGWLKAVDARDGRELWKFKVGSGVVGNPITYRGPDGRQYVAVLAGAGGIPGFVIGGDVPSNDPYDTRPPSPLMPDLAQHTSMGGMVWVFALDRD